MTLFSTASTEGVAIDKLTRKMHSNSSDTVAQSLKIAYVNFAQNWLLEGWMH